MCSQVRHKKKPTEYNGIARIRSFSLLDLGNGSRVQQQEHLTITFHRRYINILDISINVYIFIWNCCAMP